MRPTAILLLLIALAIGSVQAWDALRSPEDRIRGKLADAVEGFNGTRLSPVMELFAPEFRESSKGYTKEDVKSGVVATFFRDVDPKTKRFRYRAELANLVVTVTEPAAEARFEVLLLERDADEWALAWRFRVEAELADTERSGWQVLKARIETLDGARPL